MTENSLGFQCQLIITIISTILIHLFVPGARNFFFLFSFEIYCWFFFFFKRSLYLSQITKCLHRIRERHVVHVHLSFFLDVSPYTLCIFSFFEDGKKIEIIFYIGMEVRKRVNIVELKLTKPGLEFHFPWFRPRCLPIILPPPLLTLLPSTFPWPGSGLSQLLLPP